METIHYQNCDTGCLLDNMAGPNNSQKLGICSIVTQANADCFKTALTILRAHGNEIL